ncbi:MAG: DNA repair protein RadC [Terrimicrobiaceae bacterium]|nr:DNA repair protein RadC [Terrimicrobiaceae bacterium]
MRAPRIREIPETERPREKLTQRGAGSLTDAELIAIFLRTGTRDRSAIDVARDVLEARGGLHALSRATVRELVNSAKGVGPAKAAELAAVFEVGKRLARGSGPRPKLDTPQAVHDLLAPEFTALDRERLYILLVNTRHRLIWTEVVSIGSLNESIAHPREILRPALIHSAYGFVLAHNHPSGDPSPSEADKRLTRRLHEAADLFQIRLVDHVIIGSPDDGLPPYFSFKENSLL